MHAERRPPGFNLQADYLQFRRLFCSGAASPNHRSQRVEERCRPRLGSHSNLNLTISQRPTAIQPQGGLLVFRERDQLQV